MDSYDIVHVEDNRSYVAFLRLASESSGFTYHNIGTLKGLRDALPTTSARIWVLDGSFPEAERGIVENHGTEAVEAVRSRYPDAKIIMHSTELEYQEHARKLGIRAFSKLVTAADLVEEIKKLI